jgi:hypothetical protein
VEAIVAGDFISAVEFETVLLAVDVLLSAVGPFVVEL